MLKRIKILTSLVCTLAIIMSVAAMPVFASNGTVYDTKNYINAVDFDYMDKTNDTSWTGSSDYQAGLTAGYLWDCSSRKFTYNCRFTEVPDYVEIEIERYADVNASGSIALGFAGKYGAVAYADSINSCALNTKTTLTLPWDHTKAAISLNDEKELRIDFQKTGYKFYGFRFIKSKDAFEKFSATDVDVFPSKVYVDANNMSQGFTDDFSTALNAGYVNTAYATFTYDCYFDKVPDYVEIECDGKYAGSNTIGIGLDDSNYALATFTSEALIAQKTKGKIVIPLTSEAKAKITPDTLRSVVLRVDTTGVKVYSIKFSTAREVYYDDDNSTVCVYGDSSTGVDPLNKFVAISAEYSGDRFVDAVIKDIDKDKMVEWSLPITNGNTFKLFMWNNLETITPLEDSVIF